MLTFCCHFSQRHHHPLLFVEDKLMNAMLGKFNRSDNLNVTVGHDNTQLCDPQTAA